MLFKFALSVLLALLALGTIHTISFGVKSLRYPQHQANIQGAYGHRSAQELSLGNLTNLLNAVPKLPELTPCTCGVFLSGQFNRTSPVQGNPVLMNEHNEHFTCSNMGNKQCINKCLDVLERNDTRLSGTEEKRSIAEGQKTIIKSLVKHLANSPAIICGAIDRDCHKERAYLFYKNCNAKWMNSNLSAGREYCCKDGSPFKCP